MLDTTARTEGAAAASGDDFRPPARTLIDLGPRDCRWPSGRDQITFSCFNERIGNLPYCLGHCRIAYRPGGR
jgi:hypothetical protein